MWKIAYENASANDVVNLGPEGARIVQHGLELALDQEILPGKPPPGYELPHWLFEFGPYGVAAIIDHENKLIMVLAVGRLSLLYPDKT